MVRHLFSESLKRSKPSFMWNSDLIRTSTHSLSDYESLAYLIYSCSLNSRLCSHVKSFFSIICQSRFLVNGFDECANSVCFSVITKNWRFSVTEKEKPERTKMIMSRLQCVFLLPKFQIILTEQHCS